MYGLFCARTALAFTQFLPVLAGAFHALSSIATNGSALMKTCRSGGCLFCCSGAAGLIWAVLAPAFISGPVPPEAAFIVKGLVWADAFIWFWVGLMAVLTILSIWMLVGAYQIAETSYAVVYEYSYLISAGLGDLVLAGPVQPVQPWRHGPDCSVWLIITVATRRVQKLTVPLPQSPAEDKAVSVASAKR